MRQEDPVPEETVKETNSRLPVMEEETSEVDAVLGEGSDGVKVSAPLRKEKAAPPSEVTRAVATRRDRVWEDALAPGRGGARPTLQKRGPGVVGYLILLCVRPEQWPQAARCKLGLTIAAVLLAILLVGMGVGIRAGGAVVPAARAFADSYDREYPELKYSQGKLAASNEAEASRSGKFWPRLLINGVQVVIDPTGKTTTQGLGGERGILIDQKALMVRGNGEGYESSMPLAEVEELAKGFGWSGGEFKINSATLRQSLDAHGGALAWGVGLGAGFMEVLGSSLWAVVTAFLVIPVVQLVAYRLAMPRRIAFRVGLAVIVPLIVLDGTLKITGFSVARALTGEWVLMFWFACAAALAGWAGWLANAEYAPKTSRGRSHE